MVRLSFGGGSFTEPGLLDANVMEQLGAAERRTGVVSEYRTAAGRFAYLLEALHAQTGQRVAVLVDEYDKPILDALETREVARANRDYLRGLYGVIKDSDAHVRFTFLTGVSRFSKVNLFSQLNNLTDITLDPVYSSICGYTEGDLDTVFSPELAGLDRERVREWYNGYSWLGAEKVYNPYDVLLLLRRGKFAAHWFETGTPALLVDTLFERRVASVSLDRTVSTEELLSAFDVGGRTAAEHIGTEALLFQTGYLTITGKRSWAARTLYRLGYPNREVRQSLNEHLLQQLVQDVQQQIANSMRLERLLAGHDCAGLEELFRAFFASIPYELFREKRHRELRGLLRERVLLLLRGAGLRDCGRGIEQPWPPGHGGAHRRPRLPVRVQGGGDGAAGLGARAATGAGLRGQVPGPRRADPPDRRGVQPPDAQRHRVRGGGRLISAAQNDQRRHHPLRTGISTAAADSGSYADIVTYRTPAASADCLLRLMSAPSIRREPIRR